MFKIKLNIVLWIAWWATTWISVTADDWPRFRGPNGSGLAPDSDSLPDQWSPTANLAWKTKLPGAGASSPIIVDGKVLVTCYSGYGVTKERQSDIKDLVRHLVCIDLKTGDVIWQKDVKAWLPEDSYYESGVSSHGYASHTPVSDGENVYVFFGKGGVHAFDLKGNQIWSADVGKESDPPKWGSSSSPILYKDLVIVTAAAESQSMFGLDKTSGKVRWRQPATGLDGMWGTPTLVEIDDKRIDLVMLVAGELWGLEPETGRLRWYAKATSSQQAYASVIANGKRVFAFSGQGAGSVAVDAGGSGNVFGSHTVWKGRAHATYGSPVRHQSKLYIISKGVLSVVDAESGRRLQQFRIKGARRVGNARFGSLDYASPIVVGNRLFYLNASGQVFVFLLGQQTEQVSINQVTTGNEVFWGSPAVSDGHLVLRSSTHLYCVADLGEKVEPPLSNLSNQQAAELSPPAASTSSNESRGRRAARRENRNQANAGEQNLKRPKRPKRPAAADR